MYLLRSRTGLRAFTQLYHSPALSANAESATLLSAGVSEVPALLRGFAQRVSFPLAQTGEGISECELVAWAVKPGDVVGPFDKLCDVQSDKAAIEITSRYGGKVLTLHHAVGSMVKVGAPLVDIEVPDDVQVAPEHLTAAPAAVTAATPTSSAPAANATRPLPPTAVTVTATKVAVQVATATTPPPEEEEEAPCHPPASAAASAVAAPAAAARPVVEEPPSVRGRPQASPAVRAYARELGVDLSEVEGTGPGGRVTRADVASYIDQLQRRGSPSAAAEDEEEMGMVLQANDFLSPIGASAAHEAAATAAAAGASAGGAGGPRFRSRGRSPEELLSQYRRMGAAAATAAVAAQEGSQLVPLRGYRRAMVAAMTAAATVPVFHFHDEVAMDRLLAAREAMRADPLLGTVGGGGGGGGAAGGGAAAAAGGGGALRLTVLPLILKALSAALNLHPHLNASLAPGGTGLLLHPHHNIGVAMATPTGLVVPNIKQVERKSVAAVAAELHLLQQLAAAGRLPPEALSGGTITVSNIGTIGGTYATPLVSPPEVAIVALGRLQLMPRYSTIVNSSSSIRPPAPAGASGPAVSGASAVRGWGGGGGGRVGCERSEAAAVPLPVPVSVMPVSWGADHRVVDGAALAAFSNTWREFLEAPERLLLHLA